MFKVNQDTYPEAWLKNVFLELHKVFESFNGSMLVSVVLGLIEEDTGLLFFMNAEHPWLVLYRDGVASFIKNEHTFYKLGVTLTKGIMAVDTFRLLPGDIVIAGSDGRDDIEIFIDSKKKGINEDETKFLKHVKEGNGNLKNIYESILNSGNLSDDLSLVRIANVKPNDSLSDELILQRVDKLKRNAKSKIFNKNFPEAIQYSEEANSLNPKDNKPLINLIRIYVYQKEYSKVILYCEKYLTLNPDYYKILYLLSYSNFKVGNLKNAIEYSERLRGRKPHLIKNLILLVKLYLKKPDKERANKISLELLSLDPNNKKKTLLQKGVF